MSDSIYVNWDMVMSIKHDKARFLWAHLMKNMDKE